MVIILLCRWAEITATAFSGSDRLTFSYNDLVQKFDIYINYNHKFYIMNEHEMSMKIIPSSSVLAILGAAIVYWVLMSNFLFSTVVFVHGETDMTIMILNLFFLRQRERRTRRERFG